MNATNTIPVTRTTPAVGTRRIRAVGNPDVIAGVAFPWVVELMTPHGWRCIDGAYAERAHAETADQNITPAQVARSMELADKEAARGL